ncbi:unnamed protein product [Bursaphelenchus okinawaensis]|uniref:Uncharacterized protein n=1 Tax=Bursaphelenchus okinawaensis TaxID=465554 RepID=A0A811JUJ7_9BILA|nr:unnamed protein product [Bursaphelenchus okinawaensis]CAG9083912.1 unnamed protein product [Bursaphelenchus okinawaensis]
MDNSTVISRAKNLKMSSSTEMDEYAPLRLAMLILGVLFGLMFYLFYKFLWRPRRPRVSNYQRLNSDDMWSASLLESPQ